MTNATAIVRLQIQGDKALLRALDRLSRQGAARASRAALRAGMKPVKKAIEAEVKSQVGKKTGRLRKAVGARMARNRRSGIYQAKVGMNVGKKTGGRAPHAHLIALGTRVRTDNGANRGKVEPQPIVKRGAATGGQLSLSSLKAKLKEQIIKEAAKARRK